MNKGIHGSGFMHQLIGIRTKPLIHSIERRHTIALEEMEKRLQTLEDMEERMRPVQREGPLSFDMPSRRFSIGQRE